MKPFKTEKCPVCCSDNMLQFVIEFTRYIVLNLISSGGVWPYTRPLGITFTNHASYNVLISALNLPSKINTQSFRTRSSVTFPHTGPWLNPIADRSKTFNEVGLRESPSDTRKTLAHQVVLAGQSRDLVWNKLSNLGGLKTLNVFCNKEVADPSQRLFPFWLPPQNMLLRHHSSLQCKTDCDRDVDPSEFID